MEVKESILEQQKLQRQKIEDSFEKGTYVDNSENKRKHRVGQHWGKDEIDTRKKSAFKEMEQYKNKMLNLKRDVPNTLNNGDRWQMQKEMQEAKRAIAHRVNLLNALGKKEGSQQAMQHDADLPPEGYGYHIKSPEFSYNLGWLSDDKVRYGGWSVRNATDFDKEEFGAQFRITSPHQEEFKQIDDKWVMNVLFNSHPAKIENGWVKVLSSSDNKWKVWKKANALSFGNLEGMTGGASMYQDEYIPNRIPDHIKKEQWTLKALVNGHVNMD
jgi:hypothetical protein